MKCYNYCYKYNKCKNIKLYEISPATVSRSKVTVKVKGHSEGQGSQWRSRVTVKVKGHSKGQGSQWRSRVPVKVKGHSEGQGSQWRSRVTVKVTGHSEGQRSQWRSRALTYFQCIVVGPAADGSQSYKHTSSLTLSVNIDVNNHRYRRHNGLTLCTKHTYKHTDIQTDIQSNTIHLN